MPAPDNAQGRRTPFAVIAQWWRNWTHPGADVANPCCLDGEIDRIATDIGVPFAEVRRLAQAGPGGADLLLRRMEALNLDRNRIAGSEPETVRDLQRVCSQCESRRQCTLDLTLDRADANWEDYCPNVATLKLLRRAAQPIPR